MQIYALPMASLRERLFFVSNKLFPWVWRLAILTLPWQTRWFQEGPRIAGYPWEEGRISIYGSELLMVVTVLFSLGLWYSEKKSEQSKEARSSGWIHLFFAGLFLVFSVLTTSSLRATAEWWLEVSILLAFFWVLVQRVSVRDFSFWFILSLVPQAILGLVQSIDQRVVGSSLLGMAAQDPLTRGVAVIETGGIRWLRAYGGFPHPNIFGGWLAMGIVVSYLMLKQQRVLQKERVFYYILLVLFSIPLILTYSRSAWLGLAAFLGASTVFLIFSKTETQKKRSAFVLVIIVVSCVSGVFLRPHQFFARGRTEARLEQKSLSERAQGVQNGVRILKEQPFTGAGLGANLLVTSELDLKQGIPPSIPISPHFVPLLALAELGLVGVLILLGIMCIWFRSRMKVSSPTKLFHSATIAIVMVLIPPFFLDHYLWSYWSGKTLVLMVFFFLLKPEEQFFPHADDT